MPRAPALVPLILAAALALPGCAAKKFGPTRVVDPGAFEKGRIRKIAFLGGDTLFPDVQNRIVDGLAEHYGAVAAEGSVYRRAAVLVRLGAVHLVAPAQRKVRAEGALYGNADPAFAAQIRDKLGVDAFYVVWVLEWPLGTSESGREVVAQIFDAKDGRELWHTRWSRPPEKADPNKEILDAVEEIWVAFWIG